MPSGNAGVDVGQLVQAALQYVKPITATLAGAYIVFSAKRWYGRRTRVRRVTSRTDRDFEAFRYLYEQDAEDEFRLFGDDWDNVEDIGAWIERLDSVHLYVAKLKDDVKAYLIFIYSPDVGYGFICYLGGGGQATRGVPVTGPFSKVLARRLGRLENFKGLVFEITKPRATASEKEKRRVLAKKKRFTILLSRHASDGKARSLVPVELQTPYWAPVQSFRVNEPIDSWIFYAPAKEATPATSLSSEEARQLLQFVYACYLERYEGQDAAGFRAYVSDLYHQAVSGMSDPVPCKTYLGRRALS